MGALRLVALDLDGTLLRTDGSISERTRSALAVAEAAGLTLMSVTARPPRRVRQVAAQTGLRGTAICSNGGLVYDVTTGAVLRQNRLSAASASALIERLRAAVPGVAFAIEAGILYGCERGYVIPSEHPNDRDDPQMRRGDAVALCSEGVTKLIVQHPGRPLEELLHITRAHAGALASVTHSGSSFVEVAAAGVTKALALEAYCAEHGIAAAQVIAFGDMPNDLPMLGWAGRGVAVANAHPDVLAAADEVTSSNDHDGVALVLERLARLDFAPSWS
ncbi:Cof-type HAD-IIB family hydrolase [Sorangium sp. So ce131]|uniref:Cof-type HAD-IIB family hydrolase n=1 Tax=Sorangium sp. So ce131 TaxID=3133282 RepID=UPI003F633489